MSEFAISEVPTGKLNALVKNLMRQMNINDPNEAVRRVNAGEWFVNARSWREEDGVIYFSVTSDGTTGEQWITRLECKGFRIRGQARSILRSKDFKPTIGITTEIAVLKDTLFGDVDLITKNICYEAERRKLTKPNAEVACLIREKFTDKEIEAMDLVWIVAMHKPIEDSARHPRLLGAHRSNDGLWLDTCWGGPSDRWDRGGGSAFVVQQLIRV